MLHTFIYLQGHPAVTSSGHKPPPSYSQSTKRGSLESMPTPPPQKQYYSQFENQELTIVKQPNAAYQGPPDDGNPNMYPALPSHTTGRQPMTPGSPMNVRSGSITNITSSSLVHLQKGVEQIQQSMQEGGPFRELSQQPGQPGHPGQPGQPGMMPPLNGQPPMSSSAQGIPPGGPNSAPSSNSGPQSTQPSVNNTYVNAHMSIGQVNIQNVNASQQHAGFDSQGRPVQMQQNLDVTMNTGNMPPGSQPNFPPDHSFSNSNQQTGTNPSVKVQAKGPNTLQYLPVSQQQALPPANDPIIPKPQPDFVGPRGDPFPPHPIAGRDNKTPTSKISYYPDNSRLPPPPPQRLPSSVSGPATSQGVYILTKSTV